MAWKLFHKRKEQQKQLRPFIYVWLARVNDRLKKLAHWLEEKTSRYSTKRLKWLLALFCVPFLVLSTCIMIQGLKKTGQISFSIAPIKVARLVEEEKIESRMTAAEWQRIHHVSFYLDSLRVTKRGRRIRDSVLMYHPHLLDSIALLDSIYRVQSKK